MSFSKPQQQQQPQPQPQPQPKEYKRVGVMRDMGYTPLESLSSSSIADLEEMNEKLKQEIKIQTGKIAGLQNKRNKTMEDNNNIAAQQDLNYAMIDYRQKLLDYTFEKEEIEQTGGSIVYFSNPNQLLDRLELLAGLISAGNNGVKNEFSEITHTLRNMGFISQTDLNNLLRKYVLS